MSGPFTGSLVGKRKGDLVEIASALGIDDEGNIKDLQKRIQTKLDADAANLRTQDQFKGLYSVRGRRQHASDEDTPSPETQTPARRRRNKVVDRLAEAAAIPLPDSPIVTKIQEAAENAVTIVENEGKDLTDELSKVSGTVAKLASESRLAVGERVREARDYLSSPYGLIPAALVIEEMFLFTHVAPFTKHIITFPPPAYESGSFASLLRSLFFWLPRISWTVCYPKLEAVGPSSPLWPALTWWGVTTIMVPALVSVLVSFVPQTGVHRSGVTNRYQAHHPPLPTVDDLVYAFTRLAILVWPLTNSAPKAFVEALEMSGNTQGRVLGAALLAGLLVAHRFGQRA